jgi:hypothetical protein
MKGGTVIIVPSQGEDTGAFATVAKQLKKDVYHDKATVVKTLVHGAPIEVAFTKRGRPFSWAKVHDLRSVLTISHSGICDGPNLAYHDGGYQPWDSNCTALSADARAFWVSVGQALRAGGKIILLGCNMGGSNYAQLVATATSRAVYAATRAFAAGSAPFVLKHVRAIEKGLELDPMKRFDP